MAGNDSGRKQAPKRVGAGRQTGFDKGTDPNVGKKTQFKPGQSGNPAGKPKGLVNLSTQIQRMLNDEKFIEKLSKKIKDEAKLPDPEYQGTPMKAIIATAMVEAMSANTHPSARNAARDYLAKYGYGTKVTVEPPEDAPSLFGVAALTVKVINEPGNNTKPQTTDGV